VAVLEADFASVEKDNTDLIANAQRQL